MAMLHGSFLCDFGCNSTIRHRVLKTFLRLAVDILKIVKMLFTEKVISVKFVIVFSISKLFRSERLPDCYLIW